MIPEPVSVVMPVRNEEPHLEAAVRRVLAQDYAGEIEVVLAVGPSGDRTHEIANALAAADSRVVVVDNPTGFTPAGLNLAIKAASHESSFASTDTLSCVPGISPPLWRSSVRQEPQMWAV